MAALLLGTGCQPKQGLDASSIPHTPLPKVDARFALSAEQGGIRYQGIVPDAATRDRIAGALQAAHPGAAAGTISVEPNTHPPQWAAPLPPLSVALRKSGGLLQFRGKDIALSGDLPQENRATLLRSTRQLYPGYRLTGQFEGVDLRLALPDAGDAEALRTLLETVPLEFEAESALLASFSVESLARAARAIRAAGTAMPLQLQMAAGQGEDARAAANRRAEAIRTQLALRGVVPARIETRLVAADALNGRVALLTSPVAAAAPSGTQPGESAAAEEPDAQPAAPDPAKP